MCPKNSFEEDFVIRTIDRAIRVDVALNVLRRRVFVEVAEVKRVEIGDREIISIRSEDHMKFVALLVLSGTRRLRLAAIFARKIPSLFVLPLAIMLLDFTISTRASARGSPLFRSTA